MGWKAQGVNPKRNEKGGMKGAVGGEGTVVRLRKEKLTGHREGMGLRVQKREAVRMKLRFLA